MAVVAVADAFAVWLARVHRRVRVPTAGDGNCLFRALCYDGGGDAHVARPAAVRCECVACAAHVDALRRRVVRYVEAHAERFRVSIEHGTPYTSVAHYVRAMSRDGAWGDGTALLAYCLCTDTNVVLLSPPRGATELHPEATRGARQYIVHVGEHYEATRPVATARNGAAAVATHASAARPRGTCACAACRRRRAAAAAAVAAATRGAT